MKAFALTMILVGSVLFLVFLTLHFSISVPWNTTSMVLFAVGIAYAGLCGLKSESRRQVLVAAAGEEE
jgi:hypothetical protein